MPLVKRTGGQDRIIVRNSKVYASPVNEHMNGLFAYRDLHEGEILCVYTGSILSQREANASKSQYLFDVLYRSRVGSDTVINKVIDGQGELMGYANFSPSQHANAEAVDALPLIIDNDLPYAGRHAMVLVAKHKILKGTEIRFSYNEGMKTDMEKQMRKQGVTPQQLNDRTYLTLRYVTPPERNHAGIVEKDFPYRFISDLHVKYDMAGALVLD